MSKLFITAAALATVLASPAFAASSKHRSPVARDGMAAYGQAINGQAAGGQYYGREDQLYARDPDVVIEDNRVVGRDPDINIRSQLRKDGNVSDY